MSTTELVRRGPHLGHEIRRTAPPSFDPAPVGFGLCCAYILSQIYMVPVLIVGPSWSVWPTLPDLAVIGAALWLPFMRRRDTTPPVFVKLRRYMLILVAGCVLSYLLFTLDPFDLHSAESFNDKGPAVGLFQIYRLAQFAAVLYLATAVRMTPHRKVWIRHCLAVTFWTSCGLLLANYFDWLAPQRSPLSFLEI